MWPFIGFTPNSSRLEALRGFSQTCACGTALLRNHYYFGFADAAPRPWPVRSCDPVTFCSLSDGVCGRFSRFSFLQSFFMLECCMWPENLASLPPRTPNPTLESSAVLFLGEQTPRFSASQLDDPSSATDFLLIPLIPTGFLHNFSHFSSRSCLCLLHPTLALKLLYFWMCDRKWMLTMSFVCLFFSKVGFLSFVLALENPRLLNLEFCSSPHPLCYYTTPLLSLFDAPLL